MKDKFIFVRENQHVMILCHNEYKHIRDKEESDNKIIKTNWTPDCEKVIMIYDLKSNFTEENKSTITEKLLDL